MNILVLKPGITEASFSLFGGVYATEEVFQGKVQVVSDGLLVTLEDAGHELARVPTEGLFPTDGLTWLGQWLAQQQVSLDALVFCVSPLGVVVGGASKGSRTQSLLQMSAAQAALSAQAALVLDASLTAEQAAEQAHELLRPPEGCNQSRKRRIRCEQCVRGQAALPSDGAALQAQ